MDDLQGYCTCNECGTHQKVNKEVKEEPKHLYSPTDVAKVREKLYNEQGGKDALSAINSIGILSPINPNLETILTELFSLC